ncbi:hypothetical protein REPUB_Repub17cG0165500 [Reevesia pubescens]
MPGPIIHSHMKLVSFVMEETMMITMFLEQHEDLREALADPQGLVWQVLNAVCDICIPVASENALLCHDRVGYNKILENVKPVNDPDGRHFSSFTYLGLSPILMERQNFMEFGEAVLDLQV